MNSSLGYRNGRACQAQAPLQLAAPARAGSRDPARRSSKRRSGCSSARATRRRRWRRSPPRPASRSRPSTWRSRPRAALLRALWHLLLRGDEDDAPVAERPWYREVARGARPRAPAAPERAQLTRGQGAHRRRCCEVIRDAAPVDADIAALWSRIQTDFYDNQRAIVETPARQAGAARRASTSTRATDILWTLNHPDVWLLLVGERGWTPERVRAVVRRHRLRAAPAPLARCWLWSPPAGLTAAMKGVGSNRRGAPSLGSCPT